MQKNAFLLPALVAKALHISNSCSNDIEIIFFFKWSNFNRREWKMYNLQNSTVGKILKDKVVFFELEALLQIQWATDLNPYFD